jgi:hypothetical protein
MSGGGPVTRQQLLLLAELNVDPFNDDDDNAAGVAPQQSPIVSTRTHAQKDPSAKTATKRKTNASSGDGGTQSKRTRTSTNTQSTDSSIANTQSTIVVTAPQGNAAKAANQTQVFMVGANLTPNTRARARKVRQVPQAQQTQQATTNDANAAVTTVNP